MIIFKFLNEYLRRLYKIYAVSILGMSVAIIASFYIYLLTFKKLTMDHFPTHCLEYMRYWLENFAYKISLSWWVFAAAGGLVLVSAIITVSWQSYRAAMENPVEAIRIE